MVQSLSDPDDDGASAPAEAPQTRSGDRLQSLTRGLAVLRGFSRQHATMSVSEVAKNAQLSRAAARRVLLTLEDLGYVRSEHARYSLRPKVLELGYAYLSSLYPWDYALPVMQAFSAEVDENILAGVMDGTDVVCVARTTRKPVSVSVPVGGRIPAFASSMGRVILANEDDDKLEAYLDRVELRAYTPQTITSVEELRAELKRVRAQGWSLVEDELAVGVVGIAAPIYGPGRRVVAALNVSIHGKHDESSEHIAVTRARLLECSRELSLLFGGSGGV
ncbi:IclR family transcriptional regulator domain-containing protein [Micromonospora cremea]|uniref:Transcriptional regulator, IclR family n=1 Tax=Micromonospora cremea TaxID=709881 RepID=A0A1N5VGZ7_9ACTN|nr:IclR family transcriptional regulator C-terminal domain-containing protein [Micromonospora cremea]SIM72432.1 transcriptional regulator, IclR family [Micromonospora cremea]